MDRDLLLRMRVKDETALEALYDSYGGLVYTLALRIVGDRPLAEEVMQDTFVRCWYGAADFDPSRGTVASWLIGIARNRSIDLLRSRQHKARLRERDRLTLNSEPGEQDQRDFSDAMLLRQMVSAALDALSAVQRQAIELAYYGGLTQAEIAVSLGEPLGTVKTRIRDGLERLRQILRPLMEQDQETVP